MKALITFFLVFQPHPVNAALAARIDSMYKEDQRWRKEIIKIRKKEKSDYDEDTVNELWAKADSINEIKAKAIIKQFGYPGYNLIGESSSGRFWAIVQHCDDDIPFQEKVLQLMKKQVDKNNMSKENYAYMTDRVLVNKKQKQIYGTQCHFNDQTHLWEAFPLKYPAKVNQLRKDVGLEPLETYIKSMN